MSFKIVDQIKKSILPRPLKTVLEAYATFGNRDGTSIRPTEAAVAPRASTSRSTVSRRTQTLVGLGLLIHDLDEHGIWLKHAYGDDGTWAYVYHIDPIKLIDPILIAQWETARNELSKKRKESGAKNTKTKWPKGVSGNPKGQSNLLQGEQSKTSQPPPQQIALPLPEQNATPTSTANCYTDPTPQRPDPVDPSARSRAVDQNQVSELVNESSSSLRSSPSDAEQTFDHEKQKAKDEAFAEAMHDDQTPMPKSKYDHGLALWLSAEDLYHKMFPGKRWTDADIELLIDLARELDSGVDWHKPTGEDWHNQVVRGAGILQEAWEWNQIHKQGKYLLYSLAELANALRSTNDRNLLAQMRAHKGCKLCMNECAVDGCKTLGSRTPKGEDS